MHTGVLYNKPYLLCNYGLKLAKHGPREARKT